MRSSYNTPFPQFAGGIKGTVVVTPNSWVSDLTACIATSRLTWHSLACPSGALRAKALRACPYLSLLVTISYSYMYIHSYMYTARPETTQVKLQSKDQIIHCFPVVGHAWLAGMLTKRVSRDTAAVPWPRTVRARRGRRCSAVFRRRTDVCIHCLT